MSTLDIYLPAGNREDFWELGNYQKWLQAGTKNFRWQWLLNTLQKTAKSLFCVCNVLAWKANMDIQPVFYHYKVVQYMCSYLWKSQGQCSRTMNQAFKEAFERNYVIMNKWKYTCINK